MYTGMAHALAFFEAIRSADHDAIRRLAADERGLLDAHDPDSFGATSLNVAACRGP